MYSFIPSNPKDFEKFLDYWGEVRDLNSQESEDSIVKDPKLGLNRCRSLQELSQQPKSEYKEENQPAETRVKSRKFKSARNAKHRLSQMTEKPDKFNELQNGSKELRKVKSIPQQQDQPRSHTFRPELFHPNARAKTCDMNLRAQHAMKSDMMRPSVTDGQGQVPSTQHRQLGTREQQCRGKYEDVFMEVNEHWKSDLRCDIKNSYYYNKDKVLSKNYTVVKLQHDFDQNQSETYRSNANRAYNKMANSGTDMSHQMTEPCEQKTLSSHMRQSLRVQDAKDIEYERRFQQDQQQDPRNLKNIMSSKLEEEGEEVEKVQVEVKPKQNTNRLNQPTMARSMYMLHKRSDRKKANNKDKEFPKALGYEANNQQLNLAADKVTKELNIVHEKENYFLEGRTNQTTSKRQLEQLSTVDKNILNITQGIKTN